MEPIGLETLARVSEPEPVTVREGVPEELVIALPEIVVVSMDVSTPFKSIVLITRSW